jgi:hypothetical protein
LIIITGWRVVFRLWELDRRLFEWRCLLIWFAYELVVRMLLCDRLANQRCQIERVIFWHKWLYLAAVCFWGCTIHHDSYRLLLKRLNGSVLNTLLLNFDWFWLTGFLFNFYFYISARLTLLSWFCFKIREFYIIGRIIFEGWFFRDILSGVIWCLLLATYLLIICLGPRSIKFALQLLNLTLLLLNFTHALLNPFLDGTFNKGGWALRQTQNVRLRVVLIRVAGDVRAARSEWWSWEDFCDHVLVVLLVLVNDLGTTFCFLLRLKVASHFARYFFSWIGKVFGWSTAHNK